MTNNSIIVYEDNIRRIERGKLVTKHGASFQRVPTFWSRKVLGSGSFKNDHRPPAIQRSCLLFANCVWKASYDPDQCV